MWGWDGCDGKGFVIKGHRYSRSTFGANYWTDKSMMNEWHR